MRRGLLSPANVKLEIGLQSDHAQLQNHLLKIDDNIVQIYECIEHHQPDR